SRPGRRSTGAGSGSPYARRGGAADVSARRSRKGGGARGKKGEGGGGAGGAFNRRRERLAVRAAGGRVVRLGQMQQQRRLDVEIQEQVEQLLECVDLLCFALRHEALVAEALEVAVELREVARVRAGAEGLDRGGQRPRATVARAA